MKVIDLSTDALTLPTPAMWEAMRRAEIGMASAGADASVGRLERQSAELLGTEAALFVPTGRMGNLIALITHAEPGEHVLLAEGAHVRCCEDSSLAAIGSLVPRIVPAIDGALNREALELAIVQRHYRHVPRTGLVVIENTFDSSGGTILDVEQTRAISDVAHAHGIPVHVDGSRLFNAAVALGVPASDLVAPVDSVVFSLCKGLSAPFGALLCGSQAFIERARYRGRVLGAGSIHKLGIQAAAGLVALTTMIDRLADDHRRARALAEGLAGLPGLTVDPPRVRTNIVMLDVSATGTDADALQAALAERGILSHSRTATHLRLITHRHIGDHEIGRVIAEFDDVLRGVG